MKPKPQGPKYRNLTARGTTIYYQRRVGGRRIRFSCNTNDWAEAVRTSAKPGDKRIGYELVVPITIPDRRALEERARKEMRSLSS